ncbi:hypothetical protein RRG08_033227 [Elysia crispata]|uniref:Uncharacterized protein n=1 Tax=Elysia crispata TaxID=231223 RepID=A0AAE1CRN8_9GAST|nr:hypothetical protein RRG08_033227 [Elysia crispata]
MPRNKKSGMNSIKKNCFGHSSVGQRTLHEVVEPLEIGDQPEKKMFTLLYFVVMAGNVLIQLAVMKPLDRTMWCIGLVKVDIANATPRLSPCVDLTCLLHGTEFVQYGGLFTVKTRDEIIKHPLRTTPPGQDLVCSTRHPSIAHHWLMEF